MLTRVHPEESRFLNQITAEKVTSNGNGRLTIEFYGVLSSFQMCRYLHDLYTYKYQERICAALLTMKMAGFQAWLKVRIRY